MKNLIKYIEDYLNESLLDDEDALSDPERDRMIIENWIKDNYTIKGSLKINDGFAVDCSGSVIVKNKNITSLTNGLFRWGKVKGSFSCTRCKDLKTLEGGPEVIDGNFNCSNCKNLESLKGCSRKVDSFICHGCKNLKSLEGSPKEVGYSFHCSNCDSLRTLKGSPKEVKGSFDCSDCRNLTSLEGAPEKVGGEFWCYGCNNLIITYKDRKKYKFPS